MNIKPIRFNLKFFTNDTEFSVVRSVSELAEKSNINDLYDYFDSGVLARWLTVLGETAKAEKIRKISKKVGIESQLRQLLEALDFNLSESELTAQVKNFCCGKEVQERRLALRNDLRNVTRVVEKEMNHYTQLINDIIESAEDFAAVKAKVRALLENYPWFFHKDYFRFFYVMCGKCPLAIFAVLMDEKFRKYFLPADDAEGRKIFVQEAEPYYEPGTGPKWSLNCGTLLNARKTKDGFTFEINGKSYKDSYFFNATPPAVREVRYDRSGGDWADEADQEKKVMILYCSDNITIRPYQDRDHEVKGSDVNGQFPLFDGLEFRVSSLGTPCLLYMEAER